MNKSQEIARLKAVAKSLGPNSYCGPWLEQQLPAIEHDIRSDMPPLSTWENARKRAREIEDEAMARAEIIIAAANRDAADIRRGANEYRDNVRESVRRHIDEIQNKLI